ncbi:unnamed protein product [Blepharisma stoltei]|uniref:Uncharacterized protein n=1 Tax=Blepharisma stoltei TaxID=1481888 RepID=A0AAU9JNA5_9CILI|nr:unnamed protein product [Blepharisma stoltei]
MLSSSDPFSAPQNGPLNGLINHFIEVRHKLIFRSAPKKEKNYAQGATPGFKLESCSIIAYNQSGRNQQPDDHYVKGR